MIRFIVLGALRRFSRFKGYFALNLIGLALALASVWLVYLFISHERSYDRFVPEGERIYRFAFERTTGNSSNRYCNVPMPVGPAMDHEFSEIESMVRVKGVNALNTHQSLLRVEQQLYFTDQIFFVDSTWFKVFEYPLLKGDPAQVLNGPQQMVVTESLAMRLYGTLDVIGKNLQFQWGQPYYPVTISGVMKDLPASTHLPIEALISWETQGYGTRYDQQWKGAHVYTYIKVKEGVKAADLESRFPVFIDKYMRAQYEKENTQCSFSLQPIHDIHLDSDLLYEAYQNGERKSLRVFMLLGFFLLFLAMINYVNQSTATSLTRAREVAVNKMYGAGRRILFTRFIAESVILSLMASLLSALVVILLLPWFRNFTGAPLPFLSDHPLTFLLLLGGVAVGTGLLSGLLPAAFISGFNPLTVMKGSLGFSAQSAWVRRLLVLAQLIISVALINATLLIYKQYDYAMNRHPGFNEEDVLVIEVRDSRLAASLPAVREQLVKLAGVTGISAASNVPGTTIGQGLMSSQDQSGEIRQSDCQYMWVDKNFLSVMQIPVTFGRDFDPSFATDTTAMILNRTALELFGAANNPTGCELCFGDYDPAKQKFHCVGSTDDLLMGSVHSEVRALVMLYADLPLSVKMYLLIRIEPGSSSNLISLIHSKLSEISDNHYPEHQFLSDMLANQYQNERRMLVVFMILTSLNIIMALIGMMSLTSFTLFRRRRDLMIRKIWGASTRSNLTLVLREFILLIVLANLIAAPFTWLYASGWLENFAYRIALTPWIFVSTLAGSLLLLCVLIAGFVWNTVRQNPTGILRTS